MRARDHTRAMLAWWRDRVHRADLAFRRPSGAMIWFRDQPLDRLQVRWARAENTRGAEIYTRPARGYDWPLLFLDDLAVPIAPRAVQHYKALAVQTSNEGGCRLWLATTVALDEQERRRCQRHLATITGADPASTSGEHLGRLAGFRNHKRNGPWVNVLAGSCDPKPACSPPPDTATEPHERRTMLGTASSTRRPTARLDQRIPRHEALEHAFNVHDPAASRWGSFELPKIHAGRPRHRAGAWERASLLAWMAAHPYDGGMIAHFILLIPLFPQPPAADEPASLPDIATAAHAFLHRPGFIDLYLDADTGRALVALPPPDPDTRISLEAIYAPGLSSGLGSNPVGLDRGKLGDSALVRFLRVGRKVLLERANLAFRADSEDPRERRAVEESFAASVIWSGDVVAADADGRFLADLTSFVLSDRHDVVGTLRRGKHGRYSLDPARSAIEPARCRSFPQNLELEGRVTFAAAEDPGREVRDAAADPGAFTLVQHHSFLALPEPGYAPRPSHPRCGYSTIGYQDYAAPLAGDLWRAFILRHRLALDASGRVEEPIVYHVDPGAPAPIRDALLEGASWWREAFAAAGFEDAFRVEVLPEDVDPMDARYHVIHWVHRSTRGWSYGGSIHDPRTGEILKGNVLLGSLRVRQDRLLFEGLLGCDETGEGTPGDPVELSLARIRQLAAHEVGHTLGLSHNFAASTYGRASVMDYPAPLVRLREDGSLDAGDAYAVGVGAWDVHAIRYGYAVPPEGESEDAFLLDVIRDGDERGLLFLTDRDARPAGAAHPLANLWDNGDDPVAELGRLLDVRAAAIARFGPRNIPNGAPLASLQEVFVPLYLHHRYQVEAAARCLGGVTYTYGMRGEDAEARPVTAAQQRAALDALLSCLEPGELDIPASVETRLLPVPPGAPPRAERFAGDTGPVFDRLHAAEALAAHVLSQVLQRERLARVASQPALDPALPGIDAVLLEVVDRAVGERETDPRRRELRHVVRTALVRALVALDLDEAAAPRVRAAARRALGIARERLRRFDEGPSSWLAERIERLLERGRELPVPPPAALPPGSPIGCANG